MLGHGLVIVKYTGRKLVSVSIPDLSKEIITSVLDALQLALERADRQLESRTRKHNEHKMTVINANSLQQHNVLTRYFQGMMPRHE